VVSIDDMKPYMGFSENPLLDPSRWRSTIVKSLYLNEKSSDFDEIWYTTAHLELSDSQMTKYGNF